MAQQYQPPPLPGPQSQMPYVPQYNNQLNYPLNYPQHNMPLSLPINGRRFDMNGGHVPTPPPPLPFPGWDPAFLKQLASTQTMPLPPPPPPLSMLNQPSGSPAFPQFPYPQMPLQGAPSFMPVSQSDSRTYTPQGLSPATRSPFLHGRDDDRRLQHPQPTHRAPALAPENPFAQVPARSVVDALEATLGDEEGIKTADHNRTVSSPKGMLSARTDATIEHQSGPMTLSLRDQVKAALMDLKNGGISYTDLLKEGVAARTLEVLFKELGFELPVPVESPRLKPVPSSTDGAPHVISAAHVESSVPRTNTPQLGPADVGLERKDRIAKLLALRKGQGLASGKSSQAGSPAPQEQLSSAKPSQVVAKEASATASKEQSAFPPSSESISNAASDTRIVLESQQSILEMGTTSGNAPTVSMAIPIRAQKQDEDLSIPGLFMTSADDVEVEEHEHKADDDDDNVDEPHMKGDLAGIQTSTPSALSSGPSSSRKRSGDELIEGAPPSKRRVSGVISLSGQPESNVDSATMQDKLQAPLDSTTGLRPRINQSKLNERLAALKADILQKNSRKKALQDGMPVLDAEVAKTRARLVEQQDKLGKVRGRITSLRADLQKATAEEEQVSRELHKLQEQLAAGETGQQRFSNELARINDQEDDDRDKIDSKSATMDEARVAQNKARASRSTEDEDLSPKDVPVEASRDPSTRSPSAVEDSFDIDRAHVDFEPRDIEQEEVDQQLKADIAVPDDDVKDDQAADSDQSFSQDIDLAPEGTDDEAEDATEEVEISEVEDDDDDLMSIDEEASVARSDGSASMSDSGSEEYEPAPAVQHPEISDMSQDEGEYDPQDLDLPVSVQAETPIHNEHEPTEKVPHVPTMDLPGLSPERDDQAEMPADEPRPDDTIKPTHDLFVDNTSDVAGSPIFSTDAEVADTNVALMTVRDNVMSEDVVQTEAPAEPHERPSKFIAYQSPLTGLKSYRFHPEFKEKVKEGFRSLTYSNALDPSKPLCPTELGGAECNDADCEEQHFRSINLSDDKILVQMSSASDLKDKDQRDAYLIGLKKVIASLREKGVKEFSEVATALSQYKREWTMAQPA